jgi:hypothetical protein
MKMRVKNWHLRSDKETRLEIRVKSRRRLQQSEHVAAHLRNALWFPAKMAIRSYVAFGTLHNQHGTRTKNGIRRSTVCASFPSDPFRILDVVKRSVANGREQDEMPYSRVRDLPRYAGISRCEKQQRGPRPRLHSGTVGLVLGRHRHRHGFFLQHVTEGKLDRQRNRHRRQYCSLCEPLRDPSRFAVVAAKGVQPGARSRSSLLLSLQGHCLTPTSFCI